MHRKILLGLALVTVLIASSWASYKGWIYYKESLFQAYLASTITATSNQEIDIEQGSTVSEIAGVLKNAGVIEKQQPFINALVRLGLDRKVKAGLYRLNATLSHRQLMDKLVAGEVVSEKFTIIEGTTFAHVISKIKEHQYIDNTLAKSELDSIWQQIAPDSDKHYEGMLFADTYVFKPGTSDLELLQKSHAKLISLINSEWKNRAEGLTLKNSYEALILASIIEKETGYNDERELVASVFHNRLNLGMRLQSDPTVIYGLGDSFDGNLTRAHLKDDTIYNSYTRAGLPPSPIAIVSEASIKAALNPATSDYFYFVADNTGGHYFSKNLREHNNAVNKYQRKRNK